MQRYFAKEYKDGLVIRDSDVHHIKNVMRMKVNDKIEVVYDNKVYLCNIKNIDPFDISIISVNDIENKINLDVTIAIGLVKEQKMDLILQKLTELGVNKIIPVMMERSIVRLDDKKSFKKKERWESIVKEASEQAKRTSIPIISDVMSMKELVKLDYDVKLVGSTKNSKLFDNYLQNINKCDKIIMVIGPEGGLSDKEEDFLNVNGFNSVSFGPLIFRVETAAIYASSIFNYYSSLR